MLRVCLRRLGVPARPLRIEDRADDFGAVVRPHSKPEVRAARDESWSSSRFVRAWPRSGEPQPTGSSCSTHRRWSFNSFGCCGLVAEINRSSPGLGDQLRRATSVALNLAEGTRRIGADKRRVYRIAAAEAQELKAALAVAVAWGYLDDRATTSAMERWPSGSATYRLAR
ncbi:MAG: four helix bundle protein [Kofleriaceae bacterium]